MLTYVGKLSLALSLCILLSACGNDETQQQPAGETTPEETTTDTRTPTDDSNEAETTATSDDSAGKVTGDAENGEKLFKQTTIGGVPGCATCHSLKPGIRMVGPSMADARTMAADAAEGMSTEEFLRESITDPNAHITEGFSKGLMYQNYEKDLTQQQIEDLVAFLLTQEQE